MFYFIPLLYYTLSGLVNFLTATIIAVVVLLANSKSKTNRIFSIFSFSVAYWSLLYFIWLITKNKVWAEFWLRSCMIGVLFMPSLFINFVTSFLHREINRKFITANYILSVLFTLAVYTPIYARDIDKYLIFPYWLHTGPVFHIALIHFGITVSYSFYLMCKAINKEKGIFRNQILYVFSGTAIGFISGITNFFCWYRINIPPFLNIFISIYVIMVAYAILKYHLLDINLVLTRASIFILVYTFVLGIPFWIGYTTKLWSQSTGLALLLGIAGPSIYNYLRRKAEDVLLKEQRRYQQAITDLTKTIATIRILPELLDMETSTIAQEVRVSFCAMYLKEDEYKSFQLKSCYPKEAKSRFSEFISYDDSLITTLKARSRPLTSEEAGRQDKINLDSSGLVVPCFGKEGLLAIIFLGAKPNNTMYAEDDILTFQNLSYITSLAIENCSHWKEIEHRQRMARIEEMHTFSYSLAHEIDNPMTIIIRGLELLRRDYAEYIDNEAELKRFIELLDLMLEAALRVSGMVKAVQEFGQRTSSKFTIVKPEQAIETFLNLYLPHLKMNGIAFTKDLPEKPFPLIRGVLQEIEQTLIILAKNAVQALQNTKEKRVHLKAEIINSDWIRISLTDNGPGIEKEKLLDIFTAFYTTKGTKEGTGMGLYNATHFIVERHKGKIWAESDGPGKGATFIIELPIAKDIKPEELKEEKKSNIIKFA